MRRKSRLRSLATMIHSNSTDNDIAQDAGNIATGTDSLSNESLPNHVASVHTTLQETWVHCDDLECRWFETGCGKMLISWLKPLVGKDIAQLGVIEPLSGSLAEISNLADVRKHIWSPSVAASSTWDSVNHALAEGNMVVFLEGANEALAVDVNDFQARQITKAESEPGVVGPQSAFVEGLDKNVGLLRTILKTPHLKVELSTIGRISSTRVAICYLDDLAKKTLVSEVRERFQSVNMDGILDLNMIRESINDAPLSPFPIDQTTERPDRVAAALLQARMAILCDGSPAAMLIPATFINHLQSHEDYYFNFLATALVRILRHFMYWFSLLLVPFYVAILTYHQEMIPTRLLVSLGATHEGVPFPSSIEAFIMVLIFEALREAGIRLPKAVGQSVSIVGALVLGQAAVAAGLVSPAMVIAVALSGVASFTIPNYSLSYTNRILQFGFLGLAAVVGLLGITVGLFTLLIHLLSLRSFGIPYMAPIAPTEWKSLLRDTFTRAPWWNVGTRPAMMEPQKPTREWTAKPGPDRGENK